MLPKRTEAELDAFVEMTRNEAKPSPAPLSAETLGEEDREGLKMMKVLAKSRIYELKHATSPFDSVTYTQQERNETVARYERGIAIVDRLLNQREGE